MTTKQPESPEIKFDMVESRHGVYNVYSNNINALYTAHDVRIRFAELIKITEATESSPRVFTVEERVAVTLAWTEAKVLLNILSDIVGKFERLNGEIKTPAVP